MQKDIWKTKFMINSSKGLLVEKALPNIRLELMDQSQPGTRPPTISRRLLSGRDVVFLDIPYLLFQDRVTRRGFFIHVLPALNDNCIIQVCFLDIFIVGEAVPPYQITLDQSHKEFPPWTRRSRRARSSKVDLSPFEAAVHGRW
jgi:hypothetical protein